MNLIDKFPLFFIGKNWYLAVLIGMNNILKRCTPVLIITSLKPQASPSHKVHCTGLAILLTFELKILLRFLW